MRWFCMYENLSLRADIRNACEMKVMRGMYVYEIRLRDGHSDCRKSREGGTDSEAVQMTRRWSTNARANDRKVGLVFLNDGTEGETIGPLLRKDRNVNVIVFDQSRFCIFDGIEYSVKKLAQSPVCHQRHQQNRRWNDWANPKHSTI
jgi:hypothetical protein